MVSAGAIEAETIGCFRTYMWLLTFLFSCLTNDNEMKNSFFYIAFLCLLSVFSGCRETEKTGSLGETELYFNERLSSISADGDSAFWIGSEAGDIWYMKQRRFQSYNIGADRIYKVLTDSVLPEGRICWVGIRNSGLQKWRLEEKDTRLIRKYAIPHKGSNYSVYDILFAGQSVYVATSQGLYSMSRSGNEELKLVYPLRDSETARSGRPFIVSSVRRYGPGCLLCATQEGLLKVSLTKRKTVLSHSGEAVSQVSVYDNKVYVLAGKKLYIEDVSGRILKEVALKFSPRIHYKLGTVHYFFDDNHLLLSDDLESFVSVPLRRKVPQFCNNVVATDKVNSFTLLVTDNALWNIPLHLGIFNSNGEIVASCSDGNKIYYVNTSNELFCQRVGGRTACKVFDIPEDEVVSGMMADNRYLYYISNKQVLKRMKIKRTYISNVLFTSSQVLYQSPTKITASCLKRESDGSCIYLGIQDDLVRINADGKAVLVDALHNEYITSFYQAPRSNDLYISTLNDGVFYGEGDSYQLLKGTERHTFIRDISVTGGHKPLLMILTNHWLTCREYNDSVSLKGYNKLLRVNDSLFYALPEYGLVKFVVGKEGIKRRGRFFHDIRFNPKASFVMNDTLYLGSNIGVMKLGVFSKASVQWVDMESEVPSLTILLLVTSFVLLVVLIVVMEYFRRKRSRRKAVKTHLDDIGVRLDSLSSMARFTGDSDDKEVARLKDWFVEIDVHDSDVSEQIRALSEEIMKKNRDIALGLSKYLERQMQVMDGYDACEKSQLLSESRMALDTDNLENIVRQVEKNENWIQAVAGLKERLSRYWSELEDTVYIDKVNGCLFRKMHTLTDNMKVKEMSALEADITRLDECYRYIFTDDALKAIGTYILLKQEKLRCLDLDGVTDALLAELEHIKGEMQDLERVTLLKVLHPVDCHVEQVLIREKIASLMNEYASIRNRLERENEERITKRSDSALSLEVSESTRQITEEIEKLIVALYENMVKTDKEMLTGVLDFSNFSNQPAKVLALLMANPKIKRLYMPGMLCLYGNLNPVISRLVNNKLKTNHKLLKDYVKANPTSMVFYILRLIE